MRRSIRSILVASMLVAITVPTVSASARPQASVSSPSSDTREVAPDVKMRADLSGHVTRGPAGPVAAASRVGTEKTWLAYDDVQGIAYLKDYTLRGVGKHIEVWVSSHSDDTSQFLDFPYGDCRNGVRTRITDAQVRYLIHQFDHNIYPKEAAAWREPVGRNGKHSILASLLGLRKDYYAGGGKRIVTLVDNVRDAQFYDTDNQNQYTYIAGFFSTTLDDYFNRNVMTIDAYDWIHRTRANPPNDPVANDPCRSAPARPYLYEGVFAHEYQHLLESYSDPDEVNWVDEGLADFSIALTGYTDPRRPITDLGFDSHIQCFQGWLSKQTKANPNPREGGPENSLTLWGDQDADHESEILCDYGAAFSIMLYLFDHYGLDVMHDLHHNPGNGLVGLQRVLTRHHVKASPFRLIHRWLAMSALDRVLNSAHLIGGGERLYRASDLASRINWGNPETNDTPGAPPNGGDFVRLRDANGNLSAGEIDSIEFDGAGQLPTLPLEWTVDQAPPDHGNAALFSGTDDNLDRSIVRAVSVPTGSPVLTFDTKWSVEPDYDYGHIQVSTDNGDTYTSISCTDTVPSTDGLGPGLNGEGGWTNESCDLTAYAGQDVVIAFRLVTDGGIHFDGWWIDNVKVDTQTLSDGSSLTGWQSPTQFNPIEIDGFTVQLVAYDADHKFARIGRIALDANFDGGLDAGEVDHLLGTSAEVVAAIVTYDEPTEFVSQYAPYVLTVNGTVQPGGA